VGERGVALFSHGRAAPAASRRTFALSYVLIFLNTMQFIAMVAVAPTFQHALHLSKFETGLIFAVSGLATAAAAIPVGLLCDRIGARPVALVGATIIAAALVLQGLAPSLPWLLVARVAIGAGFSAVLSAGPTWVVDSTAPARQASAAAAVMPVAGLGLLVGPTLAGTLSDAFGRATPMLVLSGVIAACVIALLFSPPGGSLPHGHVPILHTLARGRSSVLVVAALIMFATGVLGETVSAVLGPLRLDHNGLSASAIGGVFSGGAALLVVVSLLMTRASARMTRLPVATATMVALALVLVLLAATTNTVPTSLALVLRTGVLGAIYTIAFPFAAMGAEQAGIGRGAVYAAMQLVAGTSNAIGPLAAGKIGETAGDSVAYAICAGISVVAVAWLVAASRRVRRDGAGAAVGAGAGATP
jgi:MFS family permease